MGWLGYSYGFSIPGWVVALLTYVACVAAVARYLAPKYVSAGEILLAAFCFWGTGLALSGLAIQAMVYPQDFYGAVRTLVTFVAQALIVVGSISVAVLFTPRMD